MVGREAKAFGVSANLGQAQRLGISDQNPEHPESLGAGTDPLLLLGVEAHGDEFGQGRALVIQYAECAIASPGHRSCFLDEMAKQDGEIEICLKLERRFQQTTKLGWVFDRSIGHDAVRSSASPGSGAKANGE